MTARLGRSSGYTLLELMIVVSVLGVVAMLAVPRISNSISIANEQSTKGKLNSIRKALQVYYMDNDGWYPSDLTPLLQPGSKYLTGIVPMYTSAHGSTDRIFYSDDAKDGSADTGGWGYVRSGPEWGEVWVRCTHTDRKGKPWSGY